MVDRSVLAPAPLLAVCTAAFAVSRLQLSSIHLQARHDLHAAALHRRQCTSFHAGAASVHAAAAAPNSASPPVCRAPDPPDAAACAKTVISGGQSDIVVAPSLNRLSRCIDHVVLLHACLRSKPTRACAPLGASLKKCVRSHTNATTGGAWEESNWGALAWEWTRARHGYMRVPVLDLYIGTSLLLYGEWAEAEARLFAALVRAGDTVVDAGAHLGSLSLPLAQLVGPYGRVLAFEPAPAIFRALSINIAANGVAHVVAAHPLGLADVFSDVCVPAQRINGVLNSGQTTLTDWEQDVNRSKAAARPRDACTKSVSRQDAKSVEFSAARAGVMPLDAMGLAAVALVKLDVQGMEESALRGAARTLALCQPAVYIEVEKNISLPAILQILAAASASYRCHWHTPLLFNIANHRRRALNVFGDVVSSNLLCLTSPPPQLLHGQLRPL